MGLIVAILLLGANAFFVGAEFALVSARRSKMEDLAAKGSRRAKQAIVGMRDISMILAGAQLGIALASVGLGVLTEPVLEHKISHWLELTGIPSSFGHPIAFVVTLLIVAGAHVTLGEMVPKNLAIAGPERAAVWLGPPIVAFTRTARPILWLVNELANGALRLVGIRPADEISHTYTAGDLVAMTRRSHDEGLIDSVESSLTQAALALEERSVGDVMTVWADVVTVSPDITPAQLEHVAATTGFTRFPVDGAEIRWYVHVKASLRVSAEDRDRPLADSLVHPLAQVTADTSLSRLLTRMRREQSHLALIGGPGGALGIASFDDVLASLNPGNRVMPEGLDSTSGSATGGVHDHGNAE